MTRRGHLHLSRESCRCWLLGWAFAAVIAAAALLTLATGCADSSTIDGPQITKRPEGFLFDANATAARLVFPGREKLDQLGYFTMSEENHCSIMITEYEGPSGYEDALAAVEAGSAKYGSYLDYGPVEATVIDGQPAWGWLIRQHSGGKISSYEYTALVSHEKTGTSFTVEFYAADPEFMDEDALKEVVKSFHVKT